MPSNDPRNDVPESRESVSLESVLDQYMEELAAGGSPDQEAYILAHPELADALRGVFRTLDFVEATSRSLNASALEHGQRLGEYRIIREVGRGGMGVVYEAIQTSLNRRVALKILPSGAILSENARERFLREAAMAGRLHHTNIVPVYGIGEEQGITFYAMQFIEGQSLSQHLRTMRENSTPLGRDYCKCVARWGRQVAEALAYAHSQGIIHRDIKPSNLILDAHDNVWVSDFGLARADAQVSLTITGDIVGTARYMSPEQARGGRVQVDGRTDVYSLGATLYELLALRPAFEGESREAVLSRIAFGDAAPLRKMDVLIPRDMETIVGKCMMKDPEQRYQRARDVAEDLRRFVDEEPIKARRTPIIVKVVRYARKHRMQMAAAAAVVALVLAIAALVMQVRRIQGEHQVEQAFDALLLEHESRRAIDLLDQAASRGIDSADLHLCRGLIPLLRAQSQRAIEPLTLALQREPDHVEAGLAMAWAYASFGDSVNSHRYFVRYSEDDVTTALGWLLHGYAQTHIPNASPIDSYNRAIALRADFTPAIEARAYQRANRVLVDGDRSLLEPMLNDYDAWVTFWPESARSYGARASGRLFAAAYAETQPDLRAQAPGWLDGSRRDIARASELAGEPQVGVLVRLGTYLRYMRDYEAAADTFAQAIALDRASSGEAHPGYVYHLAVALHALGRVGEALDEVEPASEALPALFPLALSRAVLLAEAGRLEEAREECRACLEREAASDGSGLLMAAGVMELLGDTTTGVAAAREFLAGHPAAASARDQSFDVIRPSLAYLVGEIDEAEFTALIGDDPGPQCEYGFLIATRELGRGNREAGLAHLQRCVDTGVFIYAQYRLAQAMLARAEADPVWPGWITNTREP